MGLGRHGEGLDMGLGRNGEGLDMRLGRHGEETRANVPFFQT